MWSTVSLISNARIPSENLMWSISGKCSNICLIRLLCSALCRQVLNPGGMVVIGVPNDYNKLQKIMSDDLGEKPWWVAPPHHINFFQPQFP